LTDFTEEEALPLRAGLAPSGEAASALLRQVLSWTGGHPYLTQKACRRVADWTRDSWNPSVVPVIVDDLVKELFLSENGQKTDDNLRFVRDRIVKGSKSRQLLGMYLHRV